MIKSAYHLTKQHARELFLRTSSQETRQKNSVH